MRPVEMIEKFYEGYCIDDVISDAEWTEGRDSRDLLEMLLRGYGLGLLAAAQARGEAPG